MLAFADVRGFHLSTVDSGEVHDIPVPEEIGKTADQVAWFPDGQKLLLTTYNPTVGYAIWRTSIFGGTPRSLWAEGYAAGVSPQGTAIAHVSGDGHEIWISGPNGEDLKLLVQDKDNAYAWLAWSPTGQRLAYLKGTPSAGTIETISSTGGAPRIVAAGPQLAVNYPLFPLAVWLPDGRLAFQQAEPESDFGNLYQIRIDPDSGKTSGTPNQMTGWHGEGPLSPSVTADGRRLVVAKVRGWSDVYLVELNEKGVPGASPTQLTTTRSYDFATTWARDSTSIVFYSNRTGRNQIFRQQLGQDAAEQLFPGSDDQQGAEFSPDGKWILYWSTPYGASPPPTTQRLMRVPVLGGSPETLLEAPIGPAVAFDCPTSALGQCVLSRPKETRLVFYHLDPILGLGKEIGGVDASTNTHWAISPDGSQMVVTDKKAFPLQMLLRNLADSTQRVLPLSPALDVRELAWTSDGRFVFGAGVRNNKGFIARIDLRGNAQVIVDLGNNVLLSPRPSPDGRHLYFTQMMWESNAWLLENF